MSTRNLVERLNRAAGLMEADTEPADHGDDPGMERTKGLKNPKPKKTPVSEVFFRMIARVAG